jgi:hypothetical protein
LAVNNLALQQLIFIFAVPSADNGQLTGLVNWFATPTLPLTVSFLTSGGVFPRESYNRLLCVGDFNYLFIAMQISLPLICQFTGEEHMTSKRGD